MVESNKVVHCLKLAAKAFHHRRKHFLKEQEASTGVIDDECQFLRVKPDVQRQQHRTCFQHTVICLQQAMAVRTQIGHTVAGSHTHRTQSPGEPKRPVRELLVRKLISTADDTDLPGVLLAGVAKKANWSKRNIHVVYGSGRLASVHYQHVSCDVVRGGGCQEDRCTLQIVVAAKPPERDRWQQLILLVLNDPVGHVGGKPSGSERININVMPCPLPCQIAR